MINPDPPLVFELPEIPAEVTELHSEERGETFTRSGNRWVQKDSSWRNDYSLAELLDVFGMVVAVVKTPEERALETLRNSSFWDSAISNAPASAEVREALLLVVRKALKED